MDITNSYPWKAHFLPMNVVSWDRDKLETALSTEFSEVDLTDYDTFEQACRSVYNEARTSKIVASRNNDRRHNTRNRKPEPTTEKPKGPTVPVLNVTTLMDSGIVLAKILDYNTDTIQLFKFEKNSMADVCVTESYLTNADLEGTNIVENSNILKLSDSVFGEEAVTRFFTANF
jgi:hypothetical protein